MVAPRIFLQSRSTSVRGVVNTFNLPPQGQLPFASVHEERHCQRHGHESALLTKQLGSVEKVLGSVEKVCQAGRTVVFDDEWGSSL